MVDYCELCGEKDRLFETITEDGVKSSCRRCLRMNNYPIIQKATVEQIKAEHRFYGNKELTQKNKERKVDPETEALDEELENIIVNKAKKKDYSELVDNFHWVIQQGRRMKKLSHKQLSEFIAEPEVLVSMAEKGELPEGYEKFISKLEQFLGVRLRKNFKKIDGISEKGFDINKADLTSVTTGDLLKLKKERIIGDFYEDENEDEIEIIDIDDNQKF